MSEYDSDSSEEYDFDEEFVNSDRKFFQITEQMTAKQAAVPLQALRITKGNFHRVTEIMVEAVRNSLTDDEDIRDIDFNNLSQIGLANIDDALQFIIADDGVINDGALIALSESKKDLVLYLSRKITPLEFDRRCLINARKIKQNTGLIGVFKDNIYPDLNKKTMALVAGTNSALFFLAHQEMNACFTGLYAALHPSNMGYLAAAAYHIKNYSKYLTTFLSTQQFIKDTPAYQAIVDTNQEVSAIDFAVSGTGMVLKTLLNVFVAFFKINENFTDALGIERKHIVDERGLFNKITVGHFAKSSNRASQAMNDSFDLVDNTADLFRIAAFIFLVYLIYVLVNIYRKKGKSEKVKKELIGGMSYEALTYGAHSPSKRKYKKRTRRKSRSRRRVGRPRGSKNKRKSPRRKSRRKSKRKSRSRRRVGRPRGSKNKRKSPRRKSKRKSRSRRRVGRPRGSKNKRKSPRRKSKRKSRSRRRVGRPRGSKNKRKSPRRKSKRKSRSRRRVGRPRGSKNKRKSPRRKSKRKSPRRKSKRKSRSRRRVGRPRGSKNKT